MNKYSFFIGKKEYTVENTSRSLEVKSPIDNKTIGVLPLLEVSEIDYAFKTAREAFKTWRNVDFKVKKDLLIKFAELLKSNTEELAELLSLEISKSISGSRTEIIRTVDMVYDLIKVYEDNFLTPDVYDQKVHGNKNKVAEFYYEPVGVVLAVSPFNYPINLLISKLVPAIMSGNTTVFKPASQGAIVSVYLTNLFREAGFPEGVINCLVLKGSEIGNKLWAHKDADVINFTGSTNVGLKIADHFKNKTLILEMGGKDAAIVLPDADIEKTADQIVKGAFSFNGQRCTAIKRVLVHKDVHQKLVSLLNEKVSNLSVGHPLEDTYITPVISKHTADKYNRLIEDAFSKKATSVHKVNTNGLLLSPVVLDNVTVDMDIAWEEQFAPVLPILEYENIEDAIRIAEESDYGLQSSVFCKKKEDFIKIAKQLTTGSVNWNASSSRSPDILPFLGVKNSGFNVQGLVDSIKTVTRLKGYVFNK